MARSAVFCGLLDPGDFSISDDKTLITIHRKIHSLRERLGDGLAERFQRLLGQIPATAGMLEAASRRDSAERTARPYLITETPWRSGYAGMGFEDVCESVAVKDAPLCADAAGFLPGADLEVWSLPIGYEPSFRFLLTPAGEWPPKSSET